MTSQARCQREFIGSFRLTFVRLVVQWSHDQAPSSCRLSGDIPPSDGGPSPGPCRSPRRVVELHRLALQVWFDHDPPVRDLDEPVLMGRDWGNGAVPADRRYARTDEGREIVKDTDEFLKGLDELLDTKSERGKVP